MSALLIFGKTVIGFLFLYRELQGEKLIGKLVEHVVFRFGKQIFDCSVIGQKVLQYGVEGFQKRGARRLLGEANDGLCVIEKDLDVSDGCRLKKINGELQNGHVVLVFRHLADGGDGEAFTVFGQIKIVRGAARGEGNRDGFDRGNEGCLHDIAQQTERDFFEAACKIGVQK